VDKRLLDILICPVSKGKLVQQGNELWSKQAALAFPIRDDSPVLVESEARSLTGEELDTLKEP